MRFRISRRPLRPVTSRTRSAAAFAVVPPAAAAPNASTEVVPASACGHPTAFEETAAAAAAFLRVMMRRVMRSAAKRVRNANTFAEVPWAATAPSAGTEGVPGSGAEEPAAFEGTAAAAAASLLLRRNSFCSMNLRRTSRTLSRLSAMRAAISALLRGQATGPVAAVSSRASGRSVESSASIHGRA